MGRRIHRPPPLDPRLSAGEGEGGESNERHLDLKLTRVFCLACTSTYRVLAYIISVKRQYHLLSTMVSPCYAVTECSSQFQHPFANCRCVVLAAVRSPLQFSIRAAMTLCASTDLNFEFYFQIPTNRYGEYHMNKDNCS